VKRICRRLGIEPPIRTLHAFRHTFATMYIQRNGSVVMLQVTKKKAAGKAKAAQTAQVVLWKQESFVVLRPLQIEFFRNLLGMPCLSRSLLQCTTQYFLSVHRGLPSSHHRRCFHRRDHTQFFPQHGWRFYHCRLRLGVGSPWGYDGGKGPWGY
jgi:hypothetical protein